MDFGGERGKGGDGRIPVVRTSSSSPTHTLSLHSKCHWNE